MFVYKLFTAESIEEKITAMQQRKAQLAEAVLGGLPAAKSPTLPNSVSA